METSPKSTSKRAARRKLRGVVISTKMTKAVVVRVDRRIPHPKYGKYFTVSKKYKVSDTGSKAHVGDIVAIEETRPISKDIRWRYVETVTAAPVDAAVIPTVTE